MFSGESGFERTRKTLPLMVPAGVAMSRLAQFNPALAQLIGKPYADYNNRLPDGRVAVYSANGSLKGYESPVGLFAKAIGWQTLTGEPEAALTSYLVKQRDKIRNIRRSYIEAMAQNDTAEMERVQNDYHRMYPELGDIVVKPQDIQAVHLRHDVSRIERVLETMPKEARQVFGPMVGVALGETAGNFLGVDPTLLGRGGSIKSRDTARVRPQSQYSTNVQDRVKANAANTGSLGLRNDHVGRQPSQPFEALGGFEGF